MRCTRRSRTREHGPRCGRADGHATGHERSQGKLGRHLLVEPPPHGRVAAAGAIENSPATFDGTPRRCGSSVGGYWEAAGWRVAVCGDRARGMGGRGGWAPRSQRLRRAMMR